MTLYKMIRSNLLFVSVVLLFNLLFALQLQEDGTGQAYASFEMYAETSVFWLVLLLVSFIFCLFSFPGAGFTLSLGGYILGLKYLAVASVLLFISTWLSFPFSHHAKLKSPFFRRILESHVMGSAVQSEWILAFLRMNPAVPFLFFAAFYKKKLRLKGIFLLAVASTFHALIYVLVGWNIRTVSLDFKSLSLFIVGFMALTLAPILLASFVELKED